MKTSSLTRRAALVGAIAATGGLVAVAPSAQAATKPSLKGVTLRIGGQTDGLASLLVASGALKGKAYKIKYSTFSSGPPLLEALQANKIDIGGVGNTPIVFAAAKRSNFRVVAALKQVSGPGDSLLVTGKSGISGPAGLKGKRIAYTRGSSGHGFLVQVLARYGLTTGDVTLVDLTPGDSQAAFADGRVDAWATYEPFVTLGQKTGGQVLDVGGKYAASGLNFVAANTKLLSDVKKRTALRDYLVRLRTAIKWGNAHQNAWATALSTESGLPQPLAVEAIKKTRVNVTAISNAIISQEQKLADALAKAKVVKKVKVAPLKSNQIK